MLLTVFWKLLIDNSNREKKKETRIVLYLLIEGTVGASMLILEETKEITVRYKFCGYDLKSGSARFIHVLRLDTTFQSRSCTHPSKRKSLTRIHHALAKVQSDPATAAMAAVVLISRQDRMALLWAANDDSMSVAAPIFRIGLQLRMASHMSPLSYHLLGLCPRRRAAKLPLRDNRRLYHRDSR
jgi:hypothetical protein